MIYASLVAARTVPPPAEDLVPRQRLLDRLDKGTRRTLTLVAARAGAGKTALVSAWTSSGHAPGPVAWVSLDGDPVRHRDFWPLVGHALPTRNGGEHAADLDGFLTKIARSRRPTVLVLDDVHTPRG